MIKPRPVILSIIFSPIANEELPSPLIPIPKDQLLKFDVDDPAEFIDVDNLVYFDHIDAILAKVDR